MSKIPPLSAAILAGGQSVRMGTDKARLRLAPHGPMLIEMVIAAVSEIADEIMVIANDNRLADLGLPIVPDNFPGTGALGGIESALTHTQREHCLIVACDMPFLARPLLAALAAEPRDYDVLAPYLTVGQNRQGQSDGIYETLHAIYGRGALPAIRTQLAAERYRVISFFQQVRVHSFPEERVRTLDPDLRSFFNANTPERLAEARVLAGVAPEMR